MLINEGFLGTDIGDTKRLINVDRSYVHKLTELRKQGISLSLNAHSSNVFMHSMALSGDPRLERTMEKYRPNFFGRYSLDLEDLIKEHSSLIGSTKDESKKFFGDTYLNLQRYPRGDTQTMRATVSFTKDTGVAKGVAKGAEGIMSPGTISKIIESGEVASRVVRGIL